MRKRRLLGGPLLEFMLIAPVLLVLMMGMVETSVLLYDKIIISDASREGARYGVVIRDQGYAEVEDVITYTKNYSNDQLISFGGSPNVSVSVTSSDEDDDGPTLGDTLTVTVSYPYTGVLFKGLGKTYNLTSSTTMAYE